MNPRILFFISLLVAVSPAAGQIAHSGQTIYTVAGTGGTSGYSGDGGRAIAATLKGPARVAVDSSGNLYITDMADHRVRKVTAKGIISTVAGNGTAGYSGDGGAATSAMLNYPAGVAVDSSGNLYIADMENYRIRKITTGGVISTVAGNGVYASSGDGGAALSASLAYPVGVAVDSSGNPYIADKLANRIRKVTAAGIISTVAGNGASGLSGDGGLATSAALSSPNGVAVDSSGNLYIADTLNRRIRKVTSGGIISTLAGGGGTIMPDGYAATSTLLEGPTDVAVDFAGGVYMVDGAIVIRHVVSGVVIWRVAGTESTVPATNLLCNGCLATNVTLNSAHGVAVDSVGNVYFAEAGASQVRAVTVGSASPLPDFVAKTAVFRSGLWVTDRNGNGQWDGTTYDLAADLGQSGDVPVAGDWNGDGRAKIGIFRNGMWVLDYNGNGQWDGPGTDRLIYLGQTGDVPVVGDWNGSGTTKAGIFRNGLWVLDYNGNGQWDGTATDKAIYMGQSGDTPVLGDWNGGGTTKVGIFRGGLWVLDFNGNGTWDGTGTDKAFYLGQLGDTPVTGDWNSSGTAKAGIFRNGLWVLDYNGSGTWDGTAVDKAIYLGQSGDTAVVGDWNGNGKTKVGVFRGGLWVLDYDGSGTWDGTSTDRAMYLGQSGDLAVIGTW